MIKILVTRGSRAFRCLWALEEAGLEYDIIAVDWRTDETKSPEFLAPNPNGHVPVFEYDGLVLIESLAINLHISQISPRALFPANSIEQSKTIQWTMWAMGELEGPHDTANRQGSDMEEELRQRALSALNQHLEQSSYLISDEFTIADLNVAAVLMRPKYMTYLSNYNQLDDWFKRCATWPALARALRR